MKIRSFALICVLSLAACSSSSSTVTPPPSVPGDRGTFKRNAAAVSGCTVRAAFPGTFDALGAVSQTEFWGAENTGDPGEGSDAETPHFIHYVNGSGQVVSAPGDTAAYTYRSIDVLSSSDVWAVGYTDPNVFQTQQATPWIVHWNGTAWSQVTLPASLSSNVTVDAVSGDSPTDIWFAGTERPVVNQGAGQVWLGHWDGSSFTHVTTAPYTSDAVADMLTFGANNVWVLLSGPSRSGKYRDAIVAHWNGSSFTFQVLPRLASQQNTGMAQQLAATSLVNIWAVANDTNAGTTNVSAVWRYTGNWQPYLYQAYSTKNVSFTGVTAFGIQNAVIDSSPAIQTQVSSGPAQILLYNGRDRWHPIPNNVGGGSYFSSKTSPVAGTMSYWVEVSQDQAMLISCS